MANIIAYAASTRPNHLWSAAQFKSADPKNRTECDIPLVSKADYDEVVALLREIYATVRGECPSLLNEDSGGNAELELSIIDAIAKAEGK